MPNNIPSSSFDPLRSKTLQEVLDSTLANQRIEGIVLSESEIDEVKRLLIASLTEPEADKPDA